MTLNKMKCLLLLAALCCMPTQAQVSFGKPTLFNEGWLFCLADDTLALNEQYDDRKWRRLDVPHDWSIEGQLSKSYASCQGYLPGGIGWYRKHFTITDDAQMHYIYFEGVYCRSTVYLNGHKLGHRPNGFASFMYDMTPYLHEGDNVISVRVDHSQLADSRWYTGSGIYRDVYLISAPRVHLSQWGVGWRATSITDEMAMVDVDMLVDNMDYAIGQVELVASITRADGLPVTHIRTSFNSHIPKQTIPMRIGKPQLWSVDSPYLYNLKVELFQDGEKIDETSCRIGLRTLHFNANNGFSLNGKNMKVKGVCLHHDAGVLGAVVPADVWRRRLQNLKDMGANAIRMSHNPQAPIVYDLCDELGLLVMDEGSDEWEFPKRKWVEGWNNGKPAYFGTFDFFEEWIERDVTDMVRRDRNHPCIFLWSVGNEVDYPNDPYSHRILDGGNAQINQPMFGGYKKDAPNAKRIGKIAKRLAACIRAVDTSRPTTGALAGVVMSNQTAYPQAIDVVGYNYTENRYDVDHKKYPKRIIYGSETGVGYSSWKDVRDKDHIFGQFVWTGTDYLGESGKWPSRGLNTGLLDFGSFKKPRGWFRASLWSEKPVTYIGTYPAKARRGRNGEEGQIPVSAEALDTWNYEEGQFIRVVCYTNSPTAKLYLDNKPVGEAKAKDDNTGIIYWDIPYKAGTLRAEGISITGKVESEYIIKTAGEPSKVIAQVDKKELKGKGSVAHVTIQVVDENGVIVKSANNEITCEVEGSGKLLGLEASNNTDMSDYHDNRQASYHGQILAYITSQGSGNIRVKLSSPGLKGTELTIQSK